MENVMPSKSTMATAAGSVGIAASINIVVSWALWKWLGVDLPNDVAIASTNIMGAIIHMIVRMFEKRMNIDLDGDGDIPSDVVAGTPPQPTPNPTTPTTEGNPA